VAGEPIRCWRDDGFVECFAVPRRGSKGERVRRALLDRVDSSRSMQCNAKKKQGSQPGRLATCNQQPHAALERELHSVLERELHSASSCSCNEQASAASIPPWKMGRMLTCGGSTTKRVTTPLCSRDVRERSQGVRLLAVRVREPPDSGFLSPAPVVCVSRHRCHLAFLAGRGGTVGPRARHHGEAAARSRRDSPPPRGGRRLGSRVSARRPTHAPRERQRGASRNDR